MHRKMMLSVGALGTALALSACGGAVDTGTGQSADQTDGDARPAACDEENPYLAVALPNLTNPYYVAMKRGFEEEGEAQGFDVEVQIANDDDAAQLAQVQAMLQKNPCALALNAVKSEPAAAIVKAANDAGVPVFTVNVTVSEEALTDQGASIVQYLGADNVAGGTQIAEQVLADFGADAELKIGFVTEPDEVPTLLRDEGFEEAIAANPNAEVVAKVDGNVKPDDSLKAATEMLSGNPDLDVIYANTGPAAYGALQAVQGKDVKVYGFCAAEEPLTEQYAGCVAQEPEDYGRRVVQQVRDWVDGGTPQAQILRPLKMFTTGETPAPGEVG
ncbi:substrate-binding domain-containing protein [Solwaraspora sp. WMMD792]|uniref:substrate-binding domain-containing protein n=1 Tax=Solwaraspora sp. WMMD792 TaxID=3016099 RepID=UPI002415CC6A|nr:substrate-binding domain-containing protein [Solwaraspora sp. WMMD792]MDG4771576.1 substrate-binding domain-containing protein [Solwaraspora sp. WMMD792]